MEKILQARKAFSAGSSPQDLVCILAEGGSFNLYFNFSFRISKHSTRDDRQVSWQPGFSGSSCATFPVKVYGRHAGDKAVLDHSPEADCSPVG